MSLAAILTGVIPALEQELEPLIMMILSSPDPFGQIAKAKRILAMDALDAATDAGLDAALKKLHGK